MRGWSELPVGADDYPAAAALFGLRLVRCPLSTPAAGSSSQSTIAGPLQRQCVCQCRPQLGGSGDVITHAAECLCDQLVTRSGVQDGRRGIVAEGLVAAIYPAVVEDDDR